MNPFIRKVIRASAGTGKTYRLSLEYIALLLRCRREGLKFNEILVITFTKKATAEIRERIFAHMHCLISGTAGSDELRANLEPLLERPWRPEDAGILQQIYLEMLTNKSQVQISTIDAFINKLFKTIIAPYIGLSSYTINSRMDPRYFGALYSHALLPENIGMVRRLFVRSRKRALPDYEKLVEDLLRQRWLFHFISRSGTGHQPSPERAAAHFADYNRLLEEMVSQLEEYLRREKSDLDAEAALLKDYYELVFDQGEPQGDWLRAFGRRLADPDFLAEHQDVLLKDLKFWSGSKLLRKAADKPLAAELLEKSVSARRELADALYHSLFLEEEGDLERIAAMLLRKYDEMRFRDQIFSYDDISWYTYQYLYDPELSLVEADTVTNAFYEILANRVRFLLIDEFQDTSLLQFKILWPMIQEVISGQGAQNYGGVIVVGDEKQSIYGWRGGERDLLPRMAEMLGEAEELSLATSYRSSPEIIDFVNDFFGGEPLQQRLRDEQIEWPYTRCSTVRHDMSGGLFVRLHTYGQSEENDLANLRAACAELVTQEILPLLQQKRVRPGEVAILARANNDLRAIADILDEHKIDYMLESSHSLLEHRAVKPLLFLLRYLATLDFAELLKFLRSDYLLLGGSALKEILMAYTSAAASDDALPLLRRLGAALPQSEPLQRCLKMTALAETADLLTFCTRVFEEFSVTALFPQENDNKNIFFFLQIVADFCHAQREFPPTPAGFIRYCDQHEGDENWQQLGLEEIDAIRLQTVHKSKGLEFDTLFLFWPLSAGHGNGKGLSRYAVHGRTFRAVEQYALTYNYQRVLEESSLATLAEAARQQEVIEALNTFYVAVTRARRHLGIYMTGKSGKGIEGLLKRSDGKEKLSAHELILTAMYAMLNGAGRLAEMGADQAEARWGSWQPRGEGAGVAAAPAFVGEIAAALDPERGKWYRQDLERVERERFLDYKSVYVNKRRVDRGNVVHYYLSWLDYDQAAARLRAAQRTRRDFGSLLPVAEIDALIARVDQFLERQAEYFSAARWDRVLTEQTLFAPDGREQRIDRLLVSEARRELLIIDFKTGETHEQSQLDDYIRTVQNLAHVRQHGYQVRALFLEVNLE